MEPSDIRELEGQADGKGHAAATRREGLRGFGSVKLSLWSKLLGIFLVAQRIGVASAEEICHPFARFKGRFDLIGVISVFRITAATKSLSYSALNNGFFYLTGHVGPGSLSVASMLLEATRFRLAKLLSSGGGGGIYGLVELGCPNGLRYIGLKSSTECPVVNAVGASVVREHQALWEGKQGDESEGLMGFTGGEQRSLKRKGRDAKRQMKVIILKVGRREEESGRKEDVQVSLKASTGDVFFLGWLPLLLTIGVIARCCLCKEWFVAGLIALGTLGMMVSVLGLRLCLFLFSKPQVARGAPEGDCVVLDDADPNTLHVILGDEDCIQALFQRNINYQTSFINDLLFLAAAFMLYMYVIASVLWLPNVSMSGQIHFAIANLIGLVADVLKASHDSELGVAEKAREEFKIVARDLRTFHNRTAAVACVAKYAENPILLKSKKLLPCDGPVWQKWWEVLAESGGEVDRFLVKSAVAAAKDEDQELLQILLDDMTEGLGSQ